METQPRTKATNGARGHRPVIMKSKRKIKLAPKAVREMERSPVPREIARLLKTTAGKIRKRLQQMNLHRSKWKDRRKVLEAVVAAGDIKGARDLYDREYGGGGSNASESINGVGTESGSDEAQASVATDEANAPVPASPSVVAPPPSQPHEAPAEFERWEPRQLSRELNTGEPTIYGWINKAGRVAKECTRQEVLQIAAEYAQKQPVKRRARKLLAELGVTEGGGGVTGAVIQHNPHAHARAPHSPEVIDKRMLLLELRRGADWLDTHKRPSDLDAAHRVLLDVYHGLIGK